VGELEAELEEGSWILSNWTIAIIGFIFLVLKKIKPTSFKNWQLFPALN
jgi:hypothetical protein